MILQPAFKPHLIVIPIKEEGVLIFSEDVQEVMYEKLPYEISKLIMDGKTSDEIANILEHSFELSDIYFHIYEMEKLGYITERSSCNYKDSAYWSIQHVPLKENVEKKRKIYLICLFDSDINHLHHLFSTENLVLTNDIQSCDLIFVICDDYLNPKIQQIAQKAENLKKSLFLSKPLGKTPWIGPIISNYGRYCFNCLRNIIERNSILEKLAVQLSEKPLDYLCKSVVDKPAINAIALNIAIIELQKELYLQEGSDLKNNLLSINTSSWESKKHYVNIIKKCPCHNSRLRECATEITFNKNFEAQFVMDNGYRLKDADETISLYEKLIGPITGIISHLGESYEKFPYIYFSGYNRARPIKNLNDTKNTFRSSFSGKGISRQQAKASAICEALERYSGKFCGDEKIVNATFNDPSFTKIHPNNCMLFSNNQFRNREAINKLNHVFYRIPEVLNENEIIEWSLVWSLTDETEKYLPTEYLYFDTNFKNIAIACSNGCASGNTIEEAVLQGFFELIERDSAAIWWYNRIQYPEVDIASFSDSGINHIINSFKEKSKEIWCLDITADFGIPTFVCLSRARNDKKQKIIFGFGTHFDAQIALQRAVTEMCQMIASLSEIEKYKDDQNHQDILNWINNATTENLPYLLPNPSLPLTTKSTYKNISTKNLYQDIMICKRLTESKGMEFLVLNLTKKNVNIPTVKVIVPGLRHFWARFGEGRLYDVLVELGWIPKKLTEQELNPIPIFL